MDGFNSLRRTSQIWWSPQGHISHFSTGHGLYARRKGEGRRRRVRDRGTEMAFGDGEDIRLMVDDRGMSSPCSPAAAYMCLCRICHEEEEERSTTMESPCACSGTLKVTTFRLFLLLFGFLRDMWTNIRCFDAVVMLIWCSTVPVCSQGMHSEMVRWEGKQCLWDMPSGSNPFIVRGIGWWWKPKMKDLYPYFLSYFPVEENYFLLVTVHSVVYFFWFWGVLSAKCITISHSFGW